MKTIISAVAIFSLFTMAACNSSAIKQKEAALQAQQRTIDSMNVELAKKKVVDSMSEVMRMQYYIPPTTVAAVAPVAASASRSSKRSYSGQTRRASTVTQAPAPVVYQQVPVEQKKKGWSAKAKGAVIGAGTGAAAGAIINKRNRVAGAVIGGVLGAGAGTGIGAILDKKNGR
jgi:hypothetical protein